MHFEKTEPFRALFDHASQGILVTNEHGMIELINPAGAAIFGYKTEELVKQPMEILLPESMRKQHVTHRQHYHSNPQPRSMGQGIDLYGRRKDGSGFPIEISLSPYTSEGKHYVIAFFIDITLRLKLAAQREEIAVQLEKERQAGELKSRFVSIASHEFRTPLSTILSSASLINTYAARCDWENIKKHGERIKNSVAHLNNILSEFLSIGRMEDSKAAPRIEDIDVFGMIRDIEEDIRNILKPGQQFIYHSAQSPVIQSDKNYLHTILINLLTNASKYSGESSSIEIISQTEADRMHITIKDQGIGIPENEQEHLFERFFRASNAGSERGTGLGLYIVKRYSEILGGAITFSSATNKGSQFTVDLPIRFRAE